MTIKEFVENYKANRFEKAGVKPYISSAEKIRIAKEVIDFSVEYDGGFIKFDSYKKYLTFTFAMIEAHTNLRFADNWADKMQEYDALCENELLDVIIGTFRKDYYTSLEVLDMLCDDMLRDNSIEASVAKLAQNISENLDVLVGAFADNIEDLDIEKIIPRDLDLNKIAELLNAFK